MASLYLLLASLLLSLDFSCTFVLHRRAMGDDVQNSNRLMDALKVIERERQRLVNANSEVESGWPVERPMRESYMDTESLNRYPDRRYDDGDLEDERMYLGSPSTIDEEPRVSPHVQLSKEDIDSILRELSHEKDAKMRDESVDELQTTKRTRQRLLKKSPPKKLKMEDTILESKNLSPKLVAEILATVKETEREAASDNNDDDSPNSTIVPASEDELKSVLDEDGDDAIENNNETNEELPDDDNDDDALNGNTGADDDHNDDEWPLYPMSGSLEGNKEWAVDSDNQPSQVSKKINVKRKRSQFADVASSVDPDKLRDILRFVKYEDEENSNLAKALDLATKSQLQDNAQYIPKEIHYLQKAIEAEGKLIKLDSNIARGATDDIDETEVTLKRKRDDPVEPMRYGDDEASEVNNYMIAKWLEEYINNNGDDPAKEMYLNPFLRRLIEKYQGLQEDKRGYMQEEYGEGEFGPIVDNIRPDDVNQEKQLAVVNAINAYLASPGNRENELSTGIGQASLNTGECRPAAMLTDDCGMARTMGVHLDREATKLCNRYELCYTCGAVHGISQDNCNDGYIRESGKLCSFEADQGNCERDAVQFFLLLASGKRQIPADDANYICRATCVRDYIIGDTARK